MPKRPLVRGGMYKTQIMTATLYVPKARPYIMC